MTTRIRAILFDADGVIQRTPDGWREDLMAMAPGEPSAFLATLMAAEAGPVRGDGGFREAVVRVLGDFGVSRPVDDVLDVWRRVVADTEVLDRITTLRRQGFVCGLATNQHDVRATFMRATMGYDAVFDAQFYSCEMGVAKPDPSYFTAAVAGLWNAKHWSPAPRPHPSEVHFLDDNEANVEGARAAGLVATLFAEHGGRAELDRITTRPL